MRKVVAKHSQLNSCYSSNSESMLQLQLLVPEPGWPVNAIDELSCYEM